MEQANHTMKFLFPATVIWDGEQSHYNVYQFKLTQERYKAQLTSSSSANPIMEITFSKENGKWNSTSKKSQYIAELLGNDIDHLKK